MNTFIKIKVLGRGSKRFDPHLEMTINVSDIKRYWFNPEDSTVRILLSCAGASNDAGIDLASYIAGATVEQLDAIILSNNGAAAQILFGNKE